MISLVLFVLFGIPTLIHHGYPHLIPIFPKNNHHAIGNFFYATALMFVAYTGYARIATLAEEVKNPKYFIPRAIIITLIVSAVLYVAVSIIAISAVGSDHLAQVTQSRATPLEIAAQALKIPGLSIMIAIGACTAMLGVLLNLILGLSRVALAMGRKGDLPNLFSHVSLQKRIPVAAIVGVGIVIILLTFTGSVVVTWSFSAFTVLIYYAITNLAALRMPKADRLYSPVFPIIGLMACLFLAFWVPLIIWGTGLILILLGIIWQCFIACRFKTMK
ncbi:MAG: hypothetical protein A3F10_00265 [Coxiella sp. RIFCSPHIGHO2_12_FULL_42_15]|nr:MAG: hypothetical protein A3F10_00265 [Coxiella sp. RIFCSPHIGHO2_12_FULL_42_15]